MKTALKIFLGLSLLGGVAYTAFRFSPLGKKSLCKWLLDRWASISEKQPFEREQIQAELEKLDYPDLELLARYTWFHPMGKNALSDSEKRRFTGLLSRMKARRIFQRADLRPLQNTVFPG